MNEYYNEAICDYNRIYWFRQSTDVVMCARIVALQFG